MTRSRLSRRGFAMATVLMVIFMLLLFALTLADLATTQYRMAWQACEQTRAREAAQAGVGDMVDHLTGAPTWTQPIGAACDNDSSYQVQVDNNLQGATVNGGVPAYTARISSVGQINGGKQVHLLVLVQFASFPYAVAAGTSVQTGPMTVLGAPGLTSVLSNDLSLTGNVYSGGTAGNSLSAGSGTTISGRARSVGGVQLGSPSTVAQGIDQGIAPETLPNLNIASFDNSATPDVTVMNPGIPYLAPILSGPVFINGDVTLVSPVLVDAQLYVKGNLTIDVQLTGTGSIYSTGSTQIQGNSALVSTSGIAVFAQQDLTVQGLFFQGVLYTHGSLHLSNGVTVIGAALAEQTVDSTGPFQVIYLPEYTQFGSYWASHSMNGYLLNGATPLLKTMFWQEG